MSGILNADIHHYIVIPVNMENYSSLLGCAAMVTDLKTGKRSYGIVGEGGPEDQYGEVSISVVWDLNYESDGSYGPEGNFEITIFPDIRKNWEANLLNRQAEALIGGAK